MSDDMFYTMFKIPENIVYTELLEFCKFLDSCRSVAHYTLARGSQHIVIMVGGRTASLKYSDCPFPGTHDFAAGWLALEAVLTISKKLNTPLYWYEGRLQNDRFVKRNDKPIICIDYKDYIK